MTVRRLAVVVAVAALVMAAAGCHAAARSAVRGAGWEAGRRSVDAVASQLNRPGPAGRGGPPPAAGSGAPAPGGDCWVAPAANASGSCRSVNGLPDGRCTPGLTDPAIVESNVDSTICVAGYSARVRPPVSVTEPIKRAEVAAYGLSGPLSAYELDHLTPISLGGAPGGTRGDATANLWPQAWAGVDGARVKDALELRLHELVCSHKVALAVAQRAIATDWRAAYSMYVGSAVVAGGGSQ